MKKIWLIFILLYSSTLGAQELFTYSEPASNMPAHAVAVKISSQFLKGVHSGDKILQRYMPEVQLGLTKKWMLHTGVNFSNMHTPKFNWEGVRVYTKYRFLSVDDVHKHFRLAAFGAASYSRSHLDHNEINVMMGEQSGIQGGLIATQLRNKLALSASGSWSEVVNSERWNKASLPQYAGQSINYSISAGYLLVPVEYKNFDQLNVNLYMELLGSRNIGFSSEKYFIDAAPSVQAIFKSTAKLNVGYRFQLTGDIYRLSKRSWMVSFEYLFLNALKN